MIDNAYRKGQSIWHDNYKKTIKRLFKNSQNKTIIEWVSKQPGNNIGTVVPTIWNEWKNGIDQRDRRACDLCACRPKPHRYQRRQY